MNNMKSEDKRCAFASKGTGNSFNGCKTLKVAECDGLDEKCSFRKTKEQLIKENDLVIERHRSMNRCNYCKYHHGEPCKKSSEK